MKHKKNKKKGRGRDRNQPLRSAVLILLIIILGLVVLNLMASFMIKANKINDYQNSCEACAGKGMLNCINFNIKQINKNNNKEIKYEEVIINYSSVLANNVSPIPIK